MEQTTIHFKQPEPPKPPSKPVVAGCSTIRFMKVGRSIAPLYVIETYDEVKVYVVHKRKLHVTTDRMLQAQRDMDTQPSGRLSGLRLSLYPN